MHYLQAFLAIGLLFKGDVAVDGEKVSPISESSGSLITTVRRYASFFMDLAVLNYDSYKFESWILALACVQCS